MSSTTSLVDLAEQAMAAAKIIQDFLSSNNLPDLSFDENAAPRFPDAPNEVLKARTMLLDTTQLLRDLALGPAEQLKSRNLAVADLTVLNWIHHFGIAKYVPLNGRINYDDLAAAASVDGSRLRRIMRFAMLFRLFHESVPDYVSHSASSRLLITDEGLKSDVTLTCDEVFPISSKLAEAHEKFGFSTENHHTAWNLYKNVQDVPRYRWWEEHAPEKIAVFSGVMEEAWNAPERNIRYLTNGFDWKSLPQGSKVVDVGGSKGQISIALASTFPHLNFVVQDLPHNVEIGRESAPKEFGDRVEFMAHDFFTKQPIEGCEVYLLHWVLLDHQDEPAIQILRNVISSMTPRSRLVVRDGVLPNPGSWAVADEAKLRVTDLVCMTMSNAGMRDLEHWKKLFTMASPKLKLQHVSMEKGSTTTVMVLGFEN